MTCEEFESHWVEAFEASSLEARRHLASCSRCQEEVEANRAVLSLTALPDLSRKELNLLNNLAAQKSDEIPAPWRRARWSVPLALAAALAIWMVVRGEESVTESTLMAPNEMAWMEVPFELNEFIEDSLTDDVAQLEVPWSEEESL